MSALELRLGERIVTATVNADGRIVIDDVAYVVTSVGDRLYRVSSGDLQWTVAVAGPPDNRWVHVDGQVAKIEVETLGRSPRARPRSAHHDLSAPMPATVTRVLVAPGSAVARGDTLLMLEAMKMELPIRAPRDGVVKAIHCEAGQLVQPGTNLLDLE
ncbi:MAG TPA: acetyl-CoA carboxylase biotin carboxyl carrier protein subunit [Vicinamibacterales bacterium]|nr:acetyl-CoA carboxylase biotin carboxyl carrier protein subunit [Vicinamibacterales bacterium]